MNDLLLYFCRSLINRNLQEHRMYNIFTRGLIVFLLISQLGLDVFSVYQKDSKLSYTTTTLGVFLEHGQEMECCEKEIEDQVPSCRLVMSNKEGFLVNRLDFTLAPIFHIPHKISTPPPQVDLHLV